MILSLGLIFASLLPNKLIYILVILLLCLGTEPAAARVQPQRYGITVDSSSVARLARHSTDSLLRTHPRLSAKRGTVAITRRRPPADRTTDFYLILFLCILLGAIRLVNTRYFQNLLRAFGNAALSRRQLKDQLQSAPLPNFLMNLFFTFAGGAYVFYAMRTLAPQRAASHAPAGLLLSLVAGLMFIYTAKYFVMRFSGWAFRVEAITEQYIFDVFLVNKIIGIALMPFIVLIAFSGPAWTAPLVIVSCVVVAALLINRYLRSWPVFAAFFQYSKFHFFTYLCASEILPLAILMKLLMRGLLF